MTAVFDMDKHMTFPFLCLPDHGECLESSRGWKPHVSKHDPSQVMDELRSGGMYAAPTHSADVAATDENPIAASHC